MAKRRARSSQAPENVSVSGANARNSLQKPPVRKLKSARSFYSGLTRTFIYGLPLLLLVVLVFNLRRRHWLPEKPHIVAAGDSEHSVYERKLVKSNISYEDVLAGCSWTSFLPDVRFGPVSSSFEYCSECYAIFRNGKGYDMAKKFRAKFTHVSPVWYQLKRGTIELQLMGRHDADEQWIADVRKDGQPLILPRVILEVPPGEFLTKKRQRKHGIGLIVSECKNMGYDGIVLEAWSIWTAYGILRDPSLRQLAFQFIDELGSALRTTKAAKGFHDTLQLIFVIPPPNTNEYDSDTFTSTDMARLSDVVDGFSLMTYDFSSAYRPGPNAPLAWVRACLQLLLPGSRRKVQTAAKIDKETTQYKLAEKVLMGINFYGNNYVLPRGGGPILGHEYLSLLRLHKPKLFWDKESLEHYFEYDGGGKKHRVFYPSLKSIALRLEEAQAWDVSVSIWELGQGVEYFFDLL